jgi:hypothetical protein
MGCGDVVTRYRAVKRDSTQAKAGVSSSKWLLRTKAEARTDELIDQSNEAIILAPNPDVSTKYLPSTYFQRTKVILFPHKHIYPIINLHNQSVFIFASLIPPSTTPAS